MRGGCGSGQDFSNSCGAGADKKFQPAQDSTSYGVWESMGKMWSFSSLEKSEKFVWSVSMEKGNDFPDLIF